jgi:hypothetical protein
MDEPILFSSLQRNKLQQTYYYYCNTTTPPAFVGNDSNPYEVIHTEAHSTNTVNYSFTNHSPTHYVFIGPPSDNR